MADIKIIRNGARISLASFPKIGSGSENIMVAVNGSGEYSNYTAELYYGFYVGGVMQQMLAKYSSGVYTIPANALFNAGNFYLTVRLVNGNNKVSTNTIPVTIEKSAVNNDYSILPASETWQSAVDNYISYTNSKLENVSNKADNNEARINNLVGNTGDSNSEIVDARLGDDGIAYSTLGTAIRTQLNNLNNNSVEVDSLIVNNDYSKDHTIIDVPNNRIVRVSNDIGEYAKFGLPENGHGTLLKYRPFSTKDTTTGFTVYDYTVLSGDSDFSRWYAYAIDDQKVEKLKWKKIGTSYSENSVEVDSLIIDNNYAKDHTIIDVPNNRIVRVSNDIGEYAKFGLPENGHGTLLKYRPFSTKDTTTGFTVYDYTVLEGEHVFSRWYAYAINDQKVEKLKWKKIADFDELYNKGIDGLGHKNLSIVFIGDSIVEGYGSSDYNGGATGTSGHLISNNVKTWYRNTGNKCWANKMINYLIETYPNVKACNNAIGGFTTRQIYDNLDTLTLDDDGNRANVAILSIGTNDRYSSNKKFDISYYIIMIIDWLRANQIQPVVLTNTPFLNGSKGNNPESVNRAIIDGCKSADCACYTLLPSLKRYIWEHNIQVEASSDQTKLLHDELHPSDILYNIMFEMIKEILSI